MTGIEEIAVKEWAQGLSGYTPGIIKNGLEAWEEDWPPSLHEFQKACRGERSGKNEFGLDYVPEYHRGAVIVDEGKLLSSDERDRRRKDGKSKIRGILDLAKSGAKNEI